MIREAEMSIWELIPAYLTDWVEAVDAEMGLFVMTALTARVAKMEPTEVIESLLDTSKLLSRRPR